jgi:hypothetical protein
MLLCWSFTCSAQAADADQSWHAPEHWLRAHGAITPLYAAQVRGDDNYSVGVSSPFLLGFGVQYIYRFARNAGLGAGARYFAISPGNLFGHELMVPALLAIVAPWAKGFDSDLTLGVGYARAWVRGPFDSERRSTDGAYAEVGIGASRELLEGLDVSLRATAFVAFTGGQDPNDKFYQPGFGFYQVGLPFELGVRKRW